MAERLAFCEAFSKAPRDLVFDIVRSAEYIDRGALGDHQMHWYLLMVRSRSELDIRQPALLLPPPPPLPLPPLLLLQGGLSCGSHLVPSCADSLHMASGQTAAFTTPHGAAWHAGEHQQGGEDGGRA